MHDAIDAATIVKGDDPDWLWTCVAACDLLKSGLQQGEEFIALENAAVIEELVFQLFRAAPRTPERDDFEERFQQYPYFAAMSTLRGAAIELCILMMFWLSKHTESSIALEPRAALQKLPAVRQALEDELADISSIGRIPRAIIGRYLSWLFYFGEDWVVLHIDSIFPETDNALRHVAWFAHLDHDPRPIRELMPQFHPLYMEEIHRLADRKSYRASELRQKNLTDRLLVLYLWETLPNDLLEAFWQAAPSVLLRHAIWFLGTHLGLSPDQFPGESRARARFYWEARLSAAKISSTPDAFREELGMIGQWCSRNENDADWLLNQLLEMLRAGFVPGSGYSVMLWLAKLSQTHIDRVVEVLAAYLPAPGLAFETACCKRTPFERSWRQVAKRAPHKQSSGWKRSLAASLHLVKPDTWISSGPP